MCWKKISLRFVIQNLDIKFLVPQLRRLAKDDETHGMYCTNEIGVRMDLLTPAPFSGASCLTINAKTNLRTPIHPHNPHHRVNV